MSRLATAAGRLPPWSFVLAVALLLPFLLPWDGVHSTGVQLLALVLVGLSLTVSVSWLRVVTLFQPAAVAAGAAVTAGQVTGGRSLLVALPAAVAAGAAVGLVTLGLAASDPRRWLPVTSLAVTAAGVLMVPRFVFRPFRRPELLGLDLGGDRTLYLVGVAVVAAACLLLSRLQRADLGRRLAVVGAEPLLAGRSGIEPAPVWRHGLALSGALAGAAGCLVALLYEGLASPLEFAPTTAVAYVAIPLAGGASVAGAVVGALAFLLAARAALVVGLASVTLPAALLAVVAALHHPRGLAGRPSGAVDDWPRALLRRLRPP